MRLLLSCLRPSSLVRPARSGATPARFHAMAPTQVKLDGFVKGSKKSNGTSKSTAISIDDASSSTSVNNTKPATKRPRDDGTDVPASAKKSKASGTYQAFPDTDPNPSEDSVEGMTSILAKLEEVQKKSKPVQVCISRGTPHSPNGLLTAPIRFATSTH